MLESGIYGAFTKREDYRAQAEYRFAVGTIGKPKTDPLYMPVSDALLAKIRKLPLIAECCA